MVSRRILITGWKHGFRKVSCNKLLQQHARLSLAEAKARVDLILKGETVSLAVASHAVADFTRSLEELGALWEEDSEFNGPQA